MSDLGVRAEVRFSNSEMDPVTLDITQKNSSVSSTSRMSCGGEMPRSILKHNNSVEHWLYKGSIDADHDLYDGFNQSLHTGLHEWTEWRTRLNSAMVGLIATRRNIVNCPGSKKSKKNALNCLAEPDFLISQQASDFALHRAVHDHITGREGLLLHAPTFISFGLPRVKLRVNTSYNGCHSGSETPDTGSSHLTDSPRSSSNNSEINDMIGSSDFTQPAPMISRLKERVMKPAQNDNTVAIVSSAHLPVSGSSDTESLCAIFDIEDFSDDEF